MTEDEAKAKWCPFARVLSGVRTYDGTEPKPMVGWNRRDDESFGHRENIGGENHCMGSRCMAWRWEGYRAEDGKWVRNVADGQKWEPAKAEGYCGLAGRV